MLTVLLETLGGEGASFLFTTPLEVLLADRTEQVREVLDAVERRVAEGYHAAGFISYDAAPGFAPHLAARRNGDVPLLLFGIYRERKPVPAGWAPESVGEYGTLGWTPSVGPAEYSKRFARIRDCIASGDIYQVNYTFRQRFAFRGDPFAMYAAMRTRQQAPYCAYVEAGDLRVLSASPELFFSLRGDRITAEPMKGTALRRSDPTEDDAVRRMLPEDPKERAENLMITDLLRNDLGMIAATGSVKVPQMFGVSSLQTVHQMTSRVTARLREGCRISEAVAALFPCGSVTGAPKRRAMEIAAEAEDSARGLYTGAIGYISPGGDATFSVAIRTAVLDLERGTGELGIGSGVTWYSTPEGEYAECLAKASFATAPGSFRLIETLLFEDGNWFLLERHLKRLAKSAAELGFPCDRATVARKLAEAAEGKTGPLKGRVLLGARGDLTIEATLLDDAPAEPRLLVARRRVASTDPFLRHKTTLREIFADSDAKAKGCEPLFLNERGEVTETATANIMARLDGRLVTPPLVSGLLPGTLREELLETGEAVERVLTLQDLHTAEEIFLINSVRKRRRAHLLPSPY